LDRIVSSPGYQLKWPTSFNKDGFMVETAAAGDAGSINWLSRAREFGIGTDSPYSVSSGEIDDGCQSSLTSWIGQSGFNAVAGVAGGAAGDTIGFTDGFTVDQSSEVSKSIKDMIMGKSAADVVAGTTGPSSFSRRMSELNAKLNWLNSLRLGTEDSQNSLLMLIHAVSGKIPDLIKKIEESLKKVRSGLDRIKDSVMGVYIDAEKFAPPASDSATGGDGPKEVKEFENALDALHNAVVSGDHHKSLPGRTRYIVDTVKILHAHLIALVDAHDAAKAGDAPQIATKIATTVVDDVPVAFEPAVRSFDAAAMAQRLKEFKMNSEKTTLCMIYGKVDGAQTLETVADRDPCLDAHKYGMAVLDDSINAARDGDGVSSTRDV